MKTSNVILLLFTTTFFGFTAHITSAQDPNSFHDARIEEGKYTVYNNKWGDRDAYQNIWRWRFGSSWGWGSYIDKGDNGLINSPLAYVGWRWSEPSADSELPIIIWSNDLVKANATWSINGEEDRSLNVGYNLWFHDQVQALDGLDWQDNPQARISLWLQREGERVPAGTLQETVWISGVQWQLYRYQTANNNDSDLFNFLALNEPVETELTLSDFVNHIVYNKGWMNNDRLLSGIEFGCEVAEARATTFQVEDFYIDVNPEESQPQPVRETMYVNGRNLYSSTGEKVVLRGVNCGLGWVDRELREGFLQEIAKTNANCVRIVWDDVDWLPANELDEVMELCIENKMIPMVELHGATGDGVDELRRMVNYWTQPAVVDAINKHQKWMMLNVANEALRDVSNDTFSNEYRSAIEKIRNTGVKVPIVIDASNFGTNYSQIFTTWKDLRDHDPEQNLMFSVHTYWEGDEQYLEGVYNDIISGVNAENVPLLFGEGPEPTLASHCNQRSPYEFGLRKMQEEELGWLAWSWGVFLNGDCGGSGSGVSLFNITTDGLYGNWNDFNNDGINNDYGYNLVVGDPNSLQNTSIRPEGLR